MVRKFAKLSPPYRKNVGNRILVGTPLSLGVTEVQMIDKNMIFNAKKNTQTQTIGWMQHFEPYSLTWISNKRDNRIYKGKFLDNWF